MDAVTNLFGRNTTRADGTIAADRLALAGAEDGVAQMEVGGGQQEQRPDAGVVAEQELCAVVVQLALGRKKLHAKKKRRKTDEASRFPKKE
jgi:hypothetical protein